MFQLTFELNICINSCIHKASGEKMERTGMLF